MKKNVMMRVASALLVAVLLTTCAISGTFAKYVTSGSASDDARVAKFGVVISASGSLFEKAYIHAPSPADDTSTVLNITDAKDLVAPGTKNEDGITMQVAGVPEVDVNVKIEATGTDVFLTEGTYTDVTTGTNTVDTFDVPTGGYYPIVYNLTQTKGGVTTVIQSGTMAKIVETLNDLSQNVQANTDLDTVIGTLKLTWEWNYTDNVGVEVDDKADTVLGDLEVTGIEIKKNGAAITASDYSLTPDIDITITVTQID